jgi:hypothetical protein
VPFCTRGSLASFSSVIRVKKSLEWKLECRKFSERCSKGARDSRESRHERVVKMSTGANHAEVLAIAAFPPGLEAYWETVNQIVWNERENTSEKCELVYEISWISELGTWRRFLRSQRKLSG